MLVTTHNPVLLDAAGTSMIPFITVAHRDDRGQSHLMLMEDIQDQKVSVTVLYGGFETLTEEIEQDETFYYIAGYTSCGAPYGVTWEEMGVKQEEIYDTSG